jgi:hypothetical protein
VSANKYLEAKNSKISVGMRFKMRFEGDEAPERRFSGTIIGVGSMSTSPWANSDWRSLKVIKIFKFVGRMPFFLCICFLEHLRTYVS